MSLSFMGRDTKPYGRDWIQFSPGNGVEKFNRVLSAKRIPDLKNTIGSYRIPFQSEETIFNLSLCSKK